MRRIGIAAFGSTCTALAAHVAYSLQFDAFDERQKARNACTADDAIALTLDPAVNNSAHDVRDWLRRSSVVIITGPGASQTARDAVLGMHTESLSIVKICAEPNESLVETVERLRAKNAAPSLPSAVLAAAIAEWRAPPPLIFLRERVERCDEAVLCLTQTQLEDEATRQCCADLLSLGHCRVCIVANEALYAAEYCESLLQRAGGAPHIHIVRCSLPRGDEARARVLCYVPPARAASGGATPSEDLAEFVREAVGTRISDLEALAIEAATASSSIDMTASEGGDVPRESEEDAGETSPRGDTEVSSGLLPAPAAWPGLLPAYEASSEEGGANASIIRASLATENARPGGLGEVEEPHGGVALAARGPSSDSPRTAAIVEDTARSAAQAMQTAAQPDEEATLGGARAAAGARALLAAAVSRCVLRKRRALEHCFGLADGDSNDGGDGGDSVANVDLAAQVSPLTPPVGIWAWTWLGEIAGVISADEIGMHAQVAALTPASEVVSVALRDVLARSSGAADELVERGLAETDALIGAGLVQIDFTHTNEIEAATDRLEFCASKAGDEDGTGPTMEAKTETCIVVSPLTIMAFRELYNDPRARAVMEERLEAAYGEEDQRFLRVDANEVRCCPWCCLIWAVAPGRELLRLCRAARVPRLLALPPNSLVDARAGSQLDGECEQYRRWEAAWADALLLVYEGNGGPEGGGPVRAPSSARESPEYTAERREREREGKAAGLVLRREEKRRSLALRCKGLRRRAHVLGMAKELLPPQAHLCHELIAEYEGLTWAEESVTGHQHGAAAGTGARGPVASSGPSKIDPMKHRRVE